MSLHKQAQEHEVLEASYAKFAVRDMMKGNTWSAHSAMLESAMHRHLAYELADTARIAWDAFQEVWDAREAARGAA